MSFAAGTFTWPQFYHYPPYFTYAPSHSSSTQHCACQSWGTLHHTTPRTRLQAPAHQGDTGQAAGPVVQPGAQLLQAPQGGRPLLPALYHHATVPNNTLLPGRSP
jgi:hypothetical protein